MSTITTLPPLALVTLPRTAKVGDLLDALNPWFERAALAGLDDVPTIDEWSSWVRAIFTDRGGNLRRRTAVTKHASNAARSAAGLLKWHGSGDTLDGLFIAKFRVSAEEWARIETFAAIVLEAFGTPSRALGAWASTGLFNDKGEG